MPDYAKTYSTLVVQPVDLVNAFKLDFCFASVIKWLTKWHIDDKKSESLIKAKYYTALCTGTNEPVGLRFALRMYCLTNGFITSTNQTCPLLNVTDCILNGNLVEANKNIELLMLFND